MIQGKMYNIFHRNLQDNLKFFVQINFLFKLIIINLIVLQNK